MFHVRQCLKRKGIPLFTIIVFPFCQIPSVNGESGSFNAGEEANRDVEPVAREMKGREAINIVDLYKTFQACRKPEVKAVNGRLNESPA
jgi:ATP-binding cassette subfamily A (ABC1) protein 5